MRTILAFLAASLLNAQTACPTMEVRAAERPLLTLGDFTDAKVLATAGQTELSVTMSAESAKRVQEFTATHVGTKIAMILNGRVVSTPTIVDPITGRGFQIGPMSREEAQRVADSINRSGCGSQRKD